MSNLNTFGAHLSDFWPYVAKIGNYRKREFGHLNFLDIFLYYLITFFPGILMRNMLFNIIHYFDAVTFTTNVLRKKVV